MFLVSRSIVFHHFPWFFHHFPWFSPLMVHFPWFFRGFPHETGHFVGRAPAQVVAVAHPGPAPGQMLQKHFKGFLTGLILTSTCMCLLFIYIHMYIIYIYIYIYYIYIYSYYIHNIIYIYSYIHMGMGQVTYESTKLGGINIQLYQL